jgi:hypothetical protein
LPTASTVATTDGRTAATTGVTGARTAAIAARTGATAADHTRPTGWPPEARAAICRESKELHVSVVTRQLSLWTASPRSAWHSDPSTAPPSCSAWTSRLGR